MKDEEAVDVLRRSVRCFTGMPTFCPAAGCVGCQLFAGRDQMVPALRLAVQALEDRLREPPEVVYCRDCANEGLPGCPLVMIERARMEVICHPPDWWCASGVRKEEAG